MKGVLLFALLLSGSVLGQQAPFHKQYFVNPYVINPSLAGADDRMNLYLMHRSQWTSLPDAPVTSTLTYDAPIKHDMNGIGVSLFSDQTGIFKRNGGSVTYSHQFLFSEKTRLYIGASGNVFDNRIDFTEVEVVQEGDPYVFGTNQNKTIVDGSFGMNLRASQFDLGMAVQHIGGGRKKYEDNKNTAFYNQEWFIQTTASYKFKLGEKWSFKPLLAFSIFDFSPTRLDFNGIVSYKDKVWATGTMRPNYGYSFSAGFKLYESVTVGYSYDLITNNLRGNAGMSSEIIVGIKFGKGREKVYVFVDSDKDGVADEFDLEPNTPEGNMVNFQGITIEKTIISKDTVIIKEIINNDSTEKYMTKDEPISFFFDFDKYDIKDGQDDKIVLIVRTLKKYPNAKILLTGYTDAKGSVDYNMMLAQRRAKDVAEALIADFGIDPSRIQVLSKGKSDPLSKNRYGANRRVDADLIMDETTEVEGLKSSVNMSTQNVKETSFVIIELFPEGKSYTNELIYTIQLGAFKNIKMNETWKLAEPLYKIPLNDGTTRYFSGIYNSAAEAEARIAQIRLATFPDAFVSAYFQGERITLDKAQEIEKQMGETIIRRK